MIRVEGLSKQYKLGLTHKDLFSERLGNSLRSIINRFKQGTDSPPLNNNSSSSTESPDSFWALKDVSFEVREGEVLGIIGRNGAGKSTLLKVLSRITSPTSGRVEMYGRVASLLEVGTGFHPELTGRENIFLNGAILGMGKAEIRKKFDEIVGFAEVEKFIDTPVKRYSSGMYVRLAFGVAAHLEPDILIVDEVLAVGDMGFQKKCLNKMESVSIEGRTVLFVSHNMDAIRRLCSSVILLENGQIKQIGETNDCVTKYQSQNIKHEGVALFDPPFQFPNEMPVRVYKFSLFDESGDKCSHFSAHSNIQIQIEWENTRPVYKPRIGFILQSLNGTDVLTSLDTNSWGHGWLEPGRRVSSCILPGRILNEGEYLVELCGDSPKGNANHKAFDLGLSRNGAVLSFHVEDDMVISSKYYGEEGFRDARWPGVIMLDIKWNQEDKFINESI